jgi:dipicolinate synthase subunit A
MSKGYTYMKNQTKIAVIGGDMRQYAVARELAGENMLVNTFGLAAETEDNSTVKVCSMLSDALSSAEAVVLPLPVSTDGVTLNCLGCGNEDRILLDDIIATMRTDAVLFGGRIPHTLQAKAAQKGIRTRDYFLSERLQIKNAYITAEAALSIAMNSLDKCIRDAHVAITGTGRISRLLAELLTKLGAKVCVAARDKDKLVYFELLGCDTVPIEQTQARSRWQDELLYGYDVLFNTVPCWLFDRDFLQKADNNMIIIELASSPGGIDVCAARELGSNVIWAPSLPGKYAPYSAGALIAECISDMICKEVEL